jgi:hypothetical protein
MRARVRSRAFSKPYPRRVCRVTGIVRGAKRLKGESGSVAQAHRSERTRADPQASCVRLDALRAGSGATLNSASTCDNMRDVVANMTRQNLGTPLNVRMPIPNESPKMRKGNGNLITATDPLGDVTA